MDLSSDIGESFNAPVLAEEDYLKVEQAHLDAINTMAEVLQEVRGALRETGDEDFWWTSDQLNFYVIVGWDYHVYVGKPVPCPEGRQFKQESHALRARAAAI